jgi:hypothetical protein
MLWRVRTMRVNTSWASGAFLVLSLLAAGCGPQTEAEIESGESFVTANEAELGFWKDPFGVTMVYPGRSQFSYQGGPDWKPSIDQKMSYASGGSNVTQRLNFPHPRPYLNTEVTGYFFIRSYNGERCGKGSGISVKVRGGNHTGTSMTGCCYNLHLPYLGGNCDNFQKECPHPDYEKKTVPTYFNAPSVVGRWVGVKAVVFNEPNGGARIQMWLDYGGLMADGTPANQWLLWYDVRDNGQVFGGKRKEAFTRSPWSGSKNITTFRMDTVKNIGMRYLTVREITPPTAMPYPLRAR